MQKIINTFKIFLKHPLISGSAILFIGSMGGNILGYLFNLIMGRLLLAEDYGILAALISIFSIFSVFSTTIAITFTRFTAVFVGKNKEEGLPTLFGKGTKWVGLASVLITIILLLLNKQIEQFLNIKDTILIVFVSFTLFISFMASVPTGILQGLMKFIPISIIGILSVLSKIIFAVVLITLGFKIFGAVLAILLSSILGYFFIFIFLNRYLKKHKATNIFLPNLRREVLAYALPVFFASLGITLFSSLDVILVKHFFQPLIAGQYAALSLMGKSIFYAVGPVIAVFFPLITQKKEKGEDIFKTLVLAVLLVGIPSLMLSILYFLFPSFIVNIFFPAKIYRTVIPYLGYFSIFVFIFILISLFNSLYLTFSKTKVFLFTIGGSILEILSISLYHKNIGEVVMDLIVVSSILFLALLLYYPYVTKNKFYGKEK